MMSKTEKNANQDDALTSFLKVVSDEDRENIPAPQKDRPTRVPTRLLLTEALRVEPKQDVPLPADEKKVDDATVLVLDSAQRTDRVGLEATIAELEAAVTSQPDEWEDDEDEVLDNKTWAESAFRILEDVPSIPPMQDYPDHAQEPEAVDEPIVAVVSDAPQEVEEPDNAIEGIDNAALRAIIADVVREELSGDTGTKMTRNIHKMVRREISRMLATRDLN